MLRTRIVTALVLGGAVTLAVLFLPTWGVAAVLGILWLAGVWEWAGFARWQGLARWAYVAPFAVLMLSGPLWVLNPQLFPWGLAVAAMWWLVALGAVLSYPWTIPAPVAAVSALFALLPAWWVLTHVHGAVSQGPALVLSLLILIWAADVGAYVFGRTLGRVKLAPAVSPGKTWEGVIGGLAMAGLAAWGLSVALDLPGAVFVTVGVAAALVSVVGDLTVSMFKRSVGLKDSSHLLPGHGGVLDRIDSLTAAAPIFVLGLTLAGLL